MGATPPVKLPLPHDGWSQAARAVPRAAAAGQSMGGDFRGASP